MFLRNLNEEQQKAFLAIAMKIVGADGRLAPEERQLIEAMRFVGVVAHGNEYVKKLALDQTLFRAERFPLFVR